MISLHEFDGILLNLKNAIADESAFSKSKPFHSFESLLPSSLLKKYLNWYENPSRKETHNFVDEFLILANEALNGNK